MIKQRTSRLAWLLWLLVIVLAGLSLGIRQWNYTALIASLELTAAGKLMEQLYWGILVPAAVPAYATVGALIAARHPRNRVGWLSLLFALGIAIQDLAWQYAARAITIAPGSLPAGVVFDWLATVTFALVLILPLTLLLLYFPTGQLPSPRWRVVVWLAITANLLATVASIFLPSLNFSSVNPTSVPALAVPAERVNTVAVWVLLLLLLAAIMSLPMRWRAARGNEREQLKWLAYIGAIATVLGAVAIGDGMTRGATYVNVLLGAVAIGGMSIGVPTAIGIAILRHRLLDIDVIINRTLVYGVLTVLLATIYLGSVIALQYAVLMFTGVTQSELATVGSTLLIATLFQPLRKRLQALIDRRFYRRKYDAQTTLAVFSTRLRDETDLDHLTGDLVDVIEQTLQPAHISLWLAQPAQAPKGRG